MGLAEKDHFIPVPLLSPALMNSIQRQFFPYYKIKKICRLRAVPLRSVTSKLGRTGESELTERGTGERREEEGLHSLL